MYTVGTSGKPCPDPYSVLTKIFNLHRWLVADTSVRTALGKGTLDSLGPGVCGDLHTGILFNQESGNRWAVQGTLVRGGRSSRAQHCSGSVSPAAGHGWGLKFCHQASNKGRGA